MIVYFLLCFKTGFLFIIYNNSLMIINVKIVEFLNKIICKFNCKNERRDEKKKRRDVFFLE